MKNIYILIDFWFLWGVDEILDVILGMYWGSIVGFFGEGGLKTVWVINYYSDRFCICHIFWHLKGQRIKER